MALLFAWMIRPARCAIINIQNACFWRREFLSWRSLQFMLWSSRFRVLGSSWRLPSWRLCRGSLADPRTFAVRTMRLRASGPWLASRQVFCRSPIRVFCRAATWSKLAFHHVRRRGRGRFARRLHSAGIRPPLAEQCTPARADRIRLARRSDQCTVIESSFRLCLVAESFEQCGPTGPATLPTRRYCHVWWRDLGIRGRPTAFRQYRSSLKLPRIRRYPGRSGRIRSPV